MCIRDRFKSMEVPWLVPGFTADTFTDAKGLRYYGECRGQLLPFTDATLIPNNASLAGANPVPDGRPRIRTLSLIDGALINQDNLILIVKEHFDGGFLGSSDSQGFT